MNYRTLGRTGLRVSEIALGCEGFNGQTPAFCRALFALALENGVNCMVFLNASSMVGFLSTSRNWEKPT